jgi:hypothetical protein
MRRLSQTAAGFIEKVGSQIQAPPAARCDCGQLREDLAAEFESQRAFLTMPPHAPVARSIVAVVPHFVVVMPFPISRRPDVINWSVPIPRAVHIIRAVRNPDRDVQRVDGRHRNPAHTKQNGQKQH